MGMHLSKLLITQLIRIAIVTTTSSAATAAAVTSSTTSSSPCTEETDALLKVTWNNLNLHPILHDDHDHIIHNDLQTQNHRLPQLIVRPSGDIGNSTSKAHIMLQDNTSTLINNNNNNNNVKLQDFEMCIPRNGACIELVVLFLPAAIGYEIMWDGNRVEVGQHEFFISRMGMGQMMMTTSLKSKSITSTEIGDYCIPTCNDEGTNNNEALFEFQYWTDGIATMDEYHVREISTTTSATIATTNIRNEMVLSEVLGCGDLASGCDVPYYTLYTRRACLPRNSCYQFFIGHQHQYGVFVDDDNHVDHDFDEDHSPSYLVRFDDALVGKSKPSPVVFGENCDDNGNAFPFSPGSTHTMTIGADDDDNPASSSPSNSTNSTSKGTPDDDNTPSSSPSSNSSTQSTTKDLIIGIIIGIGIGSVLAIGVAFVFAFLRYVKQRQQRHISLTSVESDRLIEDFIHLREGREPVLADLL